MAGRQLAITGIPLFKKVKFQLNQNFWNLLWQEMKSVVSDLCHEYFDVVDIR
jgi:hypothetical protein